MIISLMHDKGGVGKSTLAVNLACALQSYTGANVLLVDADPQGSARDWHSAGGHEFLNVIGLDRHKTFEKDILPFKKQYDIIIIDTPKINAVKELMELAVKIIIASDCVVIPIPPGQFDIWASRTIVELIQHRQMIANGTPKACFIITREIVNTRLGKEIREVVGGYELPVFKSGTCNRVAYLDCLPKGESVLQSDDLKAVSEMLQITYELIEFVGGVNVSRNVKSQSFDALAT